jgi:hypothetical protein
MVVWGLAIGLLGTLALLAVSPHEWPVIGSRATDLRDSLDELRRGGPLLLGRHGFTGPFYAVGVTDDQGVYVYVPLLSRLFGVSDPVTMLRYCYAVLFGAAAGFYPLVFYRLTRSLLAGFAAPVMLLVCVMSLGFSDIYWVPAWGMLTLLPPIYLLARDWPRFGLVALVGLSLAASWLSSIRNGSGLPIVIAAVIVLLLRRWRWWRVIPAVALLVVVYISINTFVFSAIRDHRDDRIGTHALDSDQPTGHPLWHPAYLGLGYLSNDYGIHFKDGVAAARVQRDAPGARYLSGRYNSVLRKAYFNIVREHPIEVLEQYAAKGLVTIADTFLYLLPVLLTLPAMLLMGPEKRIRRRWILLTVPAMIVMFLPTMLAIPLQGYEEGLYGAIGVLGILGLAWALARVEVAVARHGSLRAAVASLQVAWSAGGDRGSPVRRSANISAVAILTLMLLALGAHAVRRDAERWQGSSSGVLIDAMPSPRSDPALDGWI